MDLYRIISPEAFMALIMNEKEHFSRPSTWDDCYETYLLQELDSEEKRRELVARILDIVSPNNPQAAIEYYMRIWHAKWWSYAQCWSLLSDSDALWRIYSYNNHSVQICSTEEKIKSMISSSEAPIGKIECRKIEYDVTENTDIFTTQIMDMNRKLTTLEPFFHKRKAFGHEQEYRVVINDDSKRIITQLSSFGARFQLDTSKLSQEQIINEICDRIERSVYKCNLNEYKDFLVPIRNISEYIKEVRVNPWAEDWYVELISEICRKYSIRFGGKSLLYTRS